MRNIAFVITLYMLSMFSIHAQHSYYKLDREQQKFILQPESSSFEKYSQDANEAIVINHDGYLKTEGTSDKAYKILEIHNIPSFTLNKINEIPFEAYNQIEYVRIKRFKEDSTIVNLNLTNFSNLEYFVVQSYDEISIQYLINELKKISFPENTEVLFIQSMIN